MLVTRKAQELDVVELTEDLPEYGLKRGERGAVVGAFDEPDEAYDLEFVDESGKSKFAYAIKPRQIENIGAIAKEKFERGIELQKSGNALEAEKELRQAITLMPTYIGVLHNSIVRSFENSEEWQRAITAMGTVVRIRPDYEIGRRNLAIAFQKYGIQKSLEDDNDSALELFELALSVAPPEEIVADIKNSIAAVFTSLGIKEYRNNNIQNSLGLMRQAFIADPNEKTRYNLGIAYVHSAYAFLDRSMFDDAVLVFERAQHAGLIATEIIHDHGVALASLKRFEEAVFMFERALELEPENDTIKSNLELARKNIETGFNAKGLTIEFEPPKLQSPTYQIAA
jgi:tetratricopeptide (TPR) repeat protein